MARRKPAWKRERKKRSRAVRWQRKQASIRAKYGPNGKPGAITVRTSSGVRVVEPDHFEPHYAESLDEKAKAAGHESYAAYMQSAAWRSRRREVLNRDKHRCVRCRSRYRLQVHHRSYEAVGAEPLEALETLCFRCHGKRHGK